MNPERLFDEGANRYDALLVVSFGGPEGMADVMPFLDNVLEGLCLPEAARRRIAARYERFGGVSPINAHTRALVAAVREDLARHGPALPVYWGNRNWRPLLPDTLRRMEADGVERALAFVTSTFGSYNGCRKYREDLYRAVQGLRRPPVLDKLRYGYNHPGFIAAFTERVAEARARIPAERRDDAAILFTAHSLPSPPPVMRPTWSSFAKPAAWWPPVWTAPPPAGRLVYQSRNARYGSGEWLGPDIRDALAEEKKRGATHVVVAPVGFVCDHMEVVMDLDVEARERADELGIDMVRAATVGTHPAFVGMIRGLRPRTLDRAPGAGRARHEGAEPRPLPPGLLPLGPPGAPGSGPLRPVRVAGRAELARTRRDGQGAAAVAAVRPPAARLTRGRAPAPE